MSASNDHTPDNQFPLYTILEQILRANDDLHARLPQELRHYHQKYVRDFRTIRLDFGQRTGKSTAILRMATPDDLIVSHYMLRDKHLHRDLNFTSVPSIIRNDDNVQTRVWKRIWVDAASYHLSMPTFADLVKVLIQNADQQFILLG